MSMRIARRWHTLATRIYSTEAVSAQVEAVGAALEDALESCSYIQESAQQAYLETDPADRQLPESYTLRYRAFAIKDIDSALRRYEELRGTLGDEAMQEVKGQQQSFALAHADTLLARDNIAAQMREDELKMAQKQAEGLSRDDLTFCSEHLHFR